VTEFENQSDSNALLDILLVGLCWTILCPSRANPLDKPTDAPDRHQDRKSRRGMFCTHPDQFSLKKYPEHRVWAQLYPLTLFVG